METTVKQRLTEIIKDKGLSVREFERICGLSNGYMKSLRYSPSEDKLSAILSAFPELNRVWLLTGEGEMYSDAPPRPVRSYTRGQPYYDVDFLGGFDLLVPDQTHTPAYLIDFPPFNRPGVVWCNISGHSMEPEISNGDVIALLPVDDWRGGLIYGDVYALVTTNGLRTVKRLRRGPSPDVLTLQPVNPDYDAQDLPADHIAQVFKLIAVVKRF